MLSIITTFSLDYVLIPLGEHWCWSLVGLKDRTYRFPTDEPESPNSFPVMAWIALLSSCLLSINKTNQFLISIADLWKNKTWLYYSHVATQNKIFRLFTCLQTIFLPPPPFYVSINFFASHECFSVQFNVRGVLQETYKWIFVMGLTAECYGREFCNAKIFRKNTALTKQIFKIPPKHTQLLHDYCTIRHVTYNN